MSPERMDEGGKGRLSQAKNGSSMPSLTRQTARPSTETKGEEIDLYTQLWLACAGALVKIPQAGDKVFYFPQGHIEQVEAYMNRDGNFEMPVYNLPSKILCKVVHVQLKAESNTDEVFAQIILLPENEEPSDEDSTSVSKSPKICSSFFSKKLTPSDTSTHGGFSVPKRHADECFPPLNMAQEPPTQELVAMDLNGSAWHFRHIFRGHPRRNLLTTGWSLFVGAKKLVPGDTVIFLGGRNGELHIGVRRATRPWKTATASVISSLSMQHGILATAFHVMSTGSMFTVYYRPWTSPVEFIVPYGQYMKSAEISYSSGTRFRMQFEVGVPEYKCTEFSGTIVSIEDVDHIRWPGSEWRRLKVQWDAVSHSHILPKSVSPWCIEPIVRPKMKLISPSTSNPKRLCPFDPLASEFPFGVKNTSIRDSEVLQGQEVGAGGSSLNQVLTNFCAMEFASYPKSDEVRKHLAVLDVNFISYATEGSKALAQKSTRPKCMLFGVDIINRHPSLQEQQCQNCSPIINRSCIKVLKYGTALGRSIDLAGFGGYKELISELDRMFEFEGTLIAETNGWRVAYRDDEGDTMLLGDCPWQEFKDMVRKMFIYCKEDAENLGPSLRD